MDTSMSTTAQHQEMLERLSPLDPEMAKKLGTDIVHLSEGELVESSDDISGNSWDLGTRNSQLPCSICKKSSQLK